MDTDKETQEKALNLLRISLAETQAIVRAYDVKAQIVGIGYIFALGVIGQFADALPKPSVYGVGFVVVAWSVVIVPIVLFGSVLYPAGRKAPRLSEPIPEDLKYILSVDPKELTSVQEISSAALRSNSLGELSYEILRLAHLRERKRKRFWGCPS